MNFKILKPQNTTYILTPLYQISKTSLATTTDWEFSMSILKNNVCVCVCVAIEDIDIWYMGIIFYIM